MAERPWLKTFQQTLAEMKSQRQAGRRRVRRLAAGVVRPRPGLSPQVEPVEDRTLLASQILFLGGHLQVFTDAGESVVIREDPASAGQLDVQINGADGNGTPDATTSEVTEISVINADGDNSVDLSNVSTTTFPNLTAITIDSGNGDDTIVGTADYMDTLIGGDGNDVITGGSSGSRIDGGDGNDTIMGGDGDDTIDAGDGEDSVLGEAGDDSILGDDGNDEISGGDGNDTVMAGDGSDTVSGDAGADSLFGDLGTDTISGGDDNDSIFGGGQADSISGDLGDDFLLANSGDDIVDAGEGDDFVRGGNGNDSILGGLGADDLIGDNGNDTVVGNDGNDSILGGGGSDSLLGDGVDTLSTETGDDTIFGNSGDDTIIGVSGADMLDGGAGNDLVRSTFDISAAETPPAPPAPTPPPPNSGSGSSILDDAIDSGGGVDSGATTAVLSNGPGDASVMVTLNAVGEFGRASNSFGVDDAFYDPVGAQTAAGTTFESYVFHRTSTTGPRQELFQAASNLSTIRASSTEANSTFSIGNLDFALVQLVEPINDTMGMQSGSLLTQTYSITNSGTASEFFEFIRYLDGDLDFDGSLIDGGGRLVTANGEEILFETDAGGTGATDTTFVGITGFGGTIPTTGRYDVTLYDVTSALRAGTNLTDSIMNDGDGDQFVDLGQEFDVTLNLQNDFTIPAGATVTYTTHTLFGSGAPDSAVTNGAPVAVDDSGSIAVGVSSSVTIDIVSNDSDPDGVLDFSTVAISTPPANGTAVSLGNGLVTYTPQPGFVGTDTFQYTVDDNGGSTSNAATVTVNVLNPDSTGDTLTGSSGNDTLIGLSGNDFFDGGIGNDSILGLGGDDTVYGGGGDDSVDGGDGVDSLFGNGGRDTLDGGNGDDFLNWRPDKDFQVTVIGSNGGDELIVTGDNSANTLTAGQNADGLVTFAQGTSVVTIDPTVEIISLNAGSGDDSIIVGDISSAGLVSIDLMGGSGNDTIDLSAAMTGDAIVMVDGGDGDDTLTGSSGSDSLAGGADNDSIDGGAGDDTLAGDSGDDTINGGDGNDSVDGGDGNDNVNGGQGDDTLNGDSGNDTIDGAEGNDSISGGFGSDNLNGSFDDDSIEGGLGADLLLGGSGHDTLDGGRDDDTLLGHSGDDKLRGDHGNDSLNGDGGDDELVGDDGNDSLIGSVGNDGLSGGDGDDFLLGDQGDDTIVGGDGDDNLVGGAGKDTLLGGQGDDSLNGNGGTDLGATGEGADSTPVAIEKIDENFMLSNAMMENLDGM